MSGRDPRHGGRVVRWLPVGLVLVLLATAFASFEYDVARRLGWAEETDPARIEPPTGLELPELTGTTPVAGDLPAVRPDPAKVRAALAPYLRDPDLGRHVMVAVGAPGMGPVFTAGAPTATPASTMKVLTGVAALSALGPAHTFETRVVSGERPGEVVLVGGGDPFLEARPAEPDAYPRPADLTTLAHETAEALRAEGVARVRLGFDDSLFSGPTWSPHWPARGSTGRITYDDEVSPITALWVDQGHEPDRTGFVDDPPARAAQVFARLLRAAGIRVAGTPARTVAAGDAPELAVVESPPVSQVVRRVLEVSDNEGAEVLAHHVALARGLTGSFADGAKAVAAELARLGVTLDPAEVVLDGSGLSRQNVLSASTLLGVLALAASPDRPDLRAAITGLPVAAFTGSLQDRFDSGPVAGRGRVRAKTGTLSGVHGLAGVTTDLAGNLLSFVLIADRVRREDTLDARQAIDEAAAALGACTCS